MKKLFFTLAMMLVGSTAAWADVYFKADPFYIEPGQEVEVPIYIYSEGEDLGTDEYGAYSVYCAFQTVFKLLHQNILQLTRKQKDFHIKRMSLEEQNLQCSFLCI